MATTVAPLFSLDVIIQVTLITSTPELTAEVVP